MTSSKENLPKKPGRKKKILSEEHAIQIENLASRGLGIMEICRALDISWDVFNRERGKAEISEALKKGQAKGLAQVTNSLYEQATNGKNTVASIFYLKNRDPQNWADKQETEVNINLREILDQAKTRITSEHIVNATIIEGEKPLEIKDNSANHLPKQKMKENNLQDLEKNDLDLEQNTEDD